MFYRGTHGWVQPGHRRDSHAPPCPFRPSCKGLATRCMGGTEEPFWVLVLVHPQESPYPPPAERGLQPVGKLALQPPSCPPCVRSDSYLSGSSGRSTETCCPPPPVPSAPHGRFRPAACVDTGSTKGAIRCDRESNCYLRNGPTIRKHIAARCCCGRTSAAPQSHASADPFIPGVTGGLHCNTFSW